MKTLPIGTTGTAARDIRCLVATIKKGSRVTITGIDNVYQAAVMNLLMSMAIISLKRGLIPSSPTALRNKFRQVI